MNRATWKALRARVIKAGGGLCANRCRSGCVLLDVVTLDPDGDVSSGFVALCRSCRVKRSWPRIAAKILATRRARRAQTKLFGLQKAS